MLITLAGVPVAGQTAAAGSAPARPPLDARAPAADAPREAVGKDAAGRDAAAGRAAAVAAVPERAQDRAPRRRRAVFLLVVVASVVLLVGVGRALGSFLS